MTSVSKSPLWIVFDIRSAINGVDSGQSRFVVSLCQALSSTFAQERDRHFSQGSGEKKLLLIGRSAPPQWVVNLVAQHPGLVTYWSGGPGALKGKWERPLSSWATFVLPEIAELTDGNFYWLAPGELDRPLFSGMRKATRQRIVQFVHSPGQWLQKKEKSFFARSQYRWLVKRSLAKGKLVCSSGLKAADTLRKTHPKNSQSVFVLNRALTSTMGARQRPTSIQDLLNSRKALLTASLKRQYHNPSSEEIDDLIKRDWVLASSMDDKGKNAGVLREMCAQLNRQRDKKVAVIRTLGEPGSHFSQPVKESQSTLDTDGILHLRLTDEELAEAYRLSNCLLYAHTSGTLALSTLEAVCSGLPVLFKEGSLAEEFFPVEELPPWVWRGSNAVTAEDWAQSVDRFLSDEGASERERHWSYLRTFASPKDALASKIPNLFSTWDELAQQLMAEICPAELQQEETRSVAS